MTYNLLNYNTSDSTRDVFFRTVIEHTQPDILVVQEIAEAAAVDSFFTRVIDRSYPGQYNTGAFVDGPDSDNGIYYKPAKISFISNTPVATQLRDINEFTLFHSGSAETLRIYSVHLKAGNTGADRTARSAEVDSLRNVTNTLLKGSNFIVLGDFNIYAANESAYVRLLRNAPGDDGHFLDAESLSGTWNNSAYAVHHTQSPRTRSFGGGANGGMDDRFDMILYSEGIATPGGAHILQGSIVNVGNDGNHYNDSINAMPNTAVPSNVANAIHYAADHIPVTALLQFTSSAPNPPSLVSPADHGSEQPTSVILRWNTSSGAQSYRLQLSTDSLFSSVIVDNSALTDTVLLVDTLASNTIYYWRVSASNLSGTSAFSGFFSFTTFNEVTQQYSFFDGWNMLSVPLTAADQRTTSLFPTATSPAYAFEPSTGYTLKDTLRNGTGYWLKFSGDQEVALTGAPRLVDSLAVSAGWNMIGSLSSPISVDSIISIPAGIISSDFFLYDTGYFAADSLLPANAYWVKTSSAGTLIINSQTSASKKPGLRR